MKEKEILKSLALNKLKNGALIYQLLDGDDLDPIIQKINNKNRECFLNNLNNFIDFFNYIFAPLNYKEASLAMVLRNKPNFLLSKRKWNEKNLKKYYLKEFKNAVLITFLDNMHFLEKQDIVNSNKAFEFLRVLIWCNYYYNHIIEVLFVNYKERLNNKIVKVNLKNKSKIEDYIKLKKEYEDAFDRLLYKISHSIIFNIIYGEILYFIIKLLPKKYKKIMIN